MNAHNHTRKDYLKLALSFKALGAGLWDYDIDADVLSFSPRCYEILGIEINNPLRTIEAIRPHIHPDDVQRVTAVPHSKSPRRFLSEDVYHVDFRILSTSGAVRWIRSLVCLGQDADSAHLKAVGWVADITEFMSFGPITSASVGLPVAARKRVASASPAITSGSSRLTKKEEECLRWVCLGKTAHEIGRLLNKSQRTVEFHLNNAVRKLGACNRIHAAALAIKSGLI